MAIEITTENIHDSLAKVLLTITPGAHVYDSPNQQKTELPAWFIVHREPTRIERKISRWDLVYSIDLVYMLDFNITGLYNEYSLIGDRLDFALNYLRVCDKDDDPAGVLSHVYDRAWMPDQSGLKYSITLRFRVAPDTVLQEHMRVIEDLNAFLKNQDDFKPVETVTISFTNTTHPEFDIVLPDTVTIAKGAYYTLPALSGKFEKDEVSYYPNRWTIGAFGATIHCNSDAVTDLVWDTKAGGKYLENVQYLSGDVQWEGIDTDLFGVATDLFDFDTMAVSGYDTQNAAVEMIDDGGSQSVLNLNGIMTFEV